MSWAKFDDQYADHPKIVAAGPLAGWLNTTAIIYCARYLTDGRVPAAAVARLANFDGIGTRTAEGWRPVDVHDLVAALVEQNLWETCEGGYRIHDYLDYNPSAEQVLREREKTAKRLGAWRDSQKKAAAKGGVPACNAVTDPVSNALVTGTPSPYPSPLASSTSVEDAAPSHPEASADSAQGAPPPVEDAPPREKGRQPKAPTEPQARDPNLSHPAVVIYKGLAHLTPDHTQRAEIVLRVTDMERWRACVRAWVLAGHNKMNIAGILDWYRGGIPQYTRSNHEHGIAKGSDASDTAKRREEEEYDNAAAVARI